MFTSSGGSLDRAFEELIQRVVETCMASVRGELSHMVATAAQATTTAASVGLAARDGQVASVQQAMNSILAPTSQTDIMAAALKSAATAAGCAALFVRRGDSFTMWRSEGLAADAVNGLRSLAGSAASPGAFKEMCDSSGSISAAASSGSWPTGMDALAGSSGIGLMPILVAGKVVAAIAAPADGTQDAAAGLEIIARVAGLSLETSGSRSASPAVAPAAAAHAPRAPEALPAAAPAPAPAGPEPMATPDAASPEVSPATPPPPDVTSLPDADQESHRKAHRFARVAVQDLMAYHKGKIPEGSNNRNLYDVLREDIEKTRENYQKKFASTAAAAYDYLHYELVVKLANNDPAVLGPNYPGPATA